MLLEKLAITNYRNLAAATLTLSPGVNCFVGQNGMGKSNVLDAIYYLSFCRGFANAQDALNVMHGEEFFIIEGDYRTDTDTPLQVCAALQKGVRKRLKVDGKDVRRLSQHVGRIPLVLIAPADSALITGGSEERRHFLDTTIVQYSPAYLEALTRYEKALKQRNALLKAETEPDAAVLDVLEEMMSESASIIHQERAAFVEEFCPLFLDIYAQLSGNESEVPGMNYVSHIARGPLAPQLREWRERERIVGYTLHGTHKDDLELLLGSFPMKREASQGQQKTFFIAMKLAQYTYLRTKGEQRTPLLLLDDIFDKLDASRVGRIVDYVTRENFGQIFITDTRRDHLDQILSRCIADYRLFHVEDGEVTPESAE